MKAAPNRVKCPYYTGRLEKELAEIAKLDLAPVNQALHKTTKQVRKARLGVAATSLAGQLVIAGHQFRSLVNSQAREQLQQPGAPADSAPQQQQLAPGGSSSSS